MKLTGNFSVKMVSFKANTTPNVTLQDPTIGYCHWVAFRRKHLKLFVTLFWRWNAQTHLHKNVYGSKPDTSKVTGYCLWIAVNNSLWKRLKHDLHLVCVCVCDLLYVCQPPMCIVYNPDLHSDIMCSAPLSFKAFRTFPCWLCVRLCWNSVLLCIVFYLDSSIVLIVLYGFKGIMGKWWLHCFFAFDSFTVWSMHTHLFIQLIYNIAALVCPFVYSFFID